MNCKYCTKKAEADYWRKIYKLTLLENVIKKMREEMRTLEDSDEKLKELAKPLVDLLAEKGHPHMSIIVNENHIKVVEDVVSIPIKA